jgi:glutamine synthetase
MTPDELKAEIAAGDIDTVLLALTDMQGRLQGKRLTAPWFLQSVMGHGAEGCNYLLAVDVDMNTVDGYAMSSWERGYGDFVMKPAPRCAWPTWSGRTARRSSPHRVRSCAPSSPASPSAAGPPTPAPSSSS